MIFLFGVAAGMYGIVTLVLGLQLTTDFCKLRKPNLLMRVVGIGMLCDFMGLLVNSVLSNNIFVLRSWPGAIAQLFNTLAVIMLLSTGEIVTGGKFPWRRSAMVLAVSLMLLLAIGFGQEPYISVAFVLSVVFITIMYTLLIYKVWKYDKLLYSNYSDVEWRDAKWYYLIAIPIVIEVAIWFFMTFNDDSKHISSLIYAFIMPFFWMAIALYAVKQKIYFGTDIIVAEEEEIVEEISTPNVKENITEENVQTTPKGPSEMYQRLDKLMKEKELFRIQDLTTLMLAEELHTNRTYVSNLLNREMHTTFYKYINALRVDYARQLIEDTDEKMAVIAIRSGFSSQSTMIRAFKENLGITPSELRVKG